MTNIATKSEDFYLSECKCFQIFTSLVSSISQQLLFSLYLHIWVKCPFFALTEHQKHPTSTPYNSTSYSVLKWPPLDGKH